MSKLALHGGTPVRRTPFTPWPQYGTTERLALTRVLESRNWGGYPSPNTEARKFAKKFAAAHDAAYGVCTSNGTVSLQLALRAGGIGRGDEVILPPLTFVATAAAVVQVGAVPVFADVRSSDYTLDPNAVLEAISDRTRAVICVHLGSSVCDLDRLVDLCREHDLLLIEDCAHMHGAKWKDKGVGSWGDFGSFSFQSSKLMTAGEGGIVLTNEERYEKRLQSLVNCGRREGSYEDADIAWLGYNFRLGEFQAAILQAQLERLPQQLRTRATRMAKFEQLLDSIDGVSTLTVDQRVTQRSGYQFAFRFERSSFAGASKDQVLRALRAEGIPVDEGYSPLNREHELFPTDTWEQWYDSGARIPKVDPTACPIALQAAEESIWLPHEVFLGTEKDVTDIAEAIAKVKDNAEALVESEQQAGETDG